MKAINSREASGPPHVGGHPLYLFLMPRSRLPNRNLTPTGPSLSPHNRRTDMPDVIFLALGCGAFIVFAAYAGALDRL